eukprot:5669348-Prymnesium_polylepis.1
MLAIPPHKRGPMLSICGSDHATMRCMLGLRRRRDAARAEPLTLAARPAARPHLTARAGARRARA